ncbi:hypothetical protein [Bradyrhizobium sp. 192]|uniref:hypothetical protein n=1 Tax=Bradyrhizobium sp. 192 TaxID=2782660 RepID=UPI001FFFECCE|nr:hypothetical protein [Bradyrhizobium sp. 192]UPJ55395.1 hypothetical protein IVB24_22315 [Bradyrhizobium sp. 192]
MAFVAPKDRVLEQSSSNSQSVFVVTGALDAGYNAFSASMAVGDTTVGAVVEPGVAFKSGLLTYSNTNEVTVTTAFESKGTFSAGGVKQVFMGMPAASALGLDGAQGLSTARKAQGRANLDVTRKNYLLNPGMMVSQENGTTAGTTNGYYPVDQWRMDFSNAGSVSVAQVASATPGGSPNRTRVTVTGADASVGSADYAMLTQRIEGRRACDLRFGSASAKSITVQIGVKAPAGTYCIGLRNGTPNRSIAGEFTIAGGEANTDVVKTVTFAGDTTGTWAVDTTIGIEVCIMLMAGSSFQQTVNTWGAASGGFATSNQFNLMGTNGNVFELFDVGMYEGGAAPSFQLPDYDDELRKCQRHYWQTAANEYLPISGTLLSGATSGKFSSMPCPVPMRTDPTVTIGTSAVVTNGPTTAALTGVTAVATGHASLMLSLTWSGSAGSAIADAIVVFGGTTPTKFSARL